MSLTKAEVKGLRSILTNILASNASKDLLKEFNITVGNATFNESEVTFKLTLEKSGIERTAVRELKLMADMFKLDLDKVAQVQGKAVRLVEYVAGNRKYPYIMEQVGTSNRYKITPEQAQRWFAA